MKSFDTELAKYTQKIRMKAAERHELRERILTYMEYHPLPKSQKKLIETIQSESFVMIPFNTWYTRIVAGVFAVIVLIAIPFAAEQAVPGDVLYLVKTNINEGIRAQFVNSPYETVAFETELMNRRIAEARLLAKEGKLTEAVEAKIAETVKGHASAAQRGLADLKATDADEGAIAEIAFGSALDVQSAVLNTEATTTINGIAGAVKDAKTNADAVKGTTTPSYERVMARVEQETTRAYELFESVKVSATPLERDDIQRRLEDIDRAVLDAQRMGEDAHGQAIAGLVKALSLTQKLIAFMTDIDVRENVALETLVPVVLTDEERTSVAKEKLTKVRATWADVQTRIEFVTDAGLKEKLTEGADDMTSYITVATSSLVSGDLGALEAVLTAAQDLLSDLDALTIDTNVFPEDIEPEQEPSVEEGTDELPIPTDDEETVD